LILIFFSRKRRKYITILLFFFCLIFSPIMIIGWPHQRLSSHELEIAKDSSIGYVRLDHLDGTKHVIGDIYKCTAVCKSGIVEMFMSNEFRKSGEVVKKSHKKGNLQRYLKLWECVEQNGIWDLKSPMEVLKSIKSLDDDPYESLPTSQDLYQYTARIGQKTYQYEVYYIDGLKDKRYKAVHDAINLFFGGEPGALHYKVQLR